MSNRRTLRTDLARGWVVSAVVQFVFIWVVSMWLYPGGNEWNPDAAGYSFWRNTFSDLGKAVAYDGRAIGASAVVFNVSLIVLMLSFGPLWWLLPNAFPTHRRTGCVVRCLGAISIVGMIGVGLTPSDRHLTLHAAAIGLAAVPGLGAYVLSCWAMLQDRTAPRSYVVYSLVFLALAMVHFAQYVGHFWLGRPWTPTCPAVQKIAVSAGWVWMLVTALLVRPGSDRTQSSR